MCVSVYEHALYVSFVRDRLISVTAGQEQFTMNENYTVGFKYLETLRDYLRIKTLIMIIT